MTAKAALCKALINGKVVNIRNGHQLFGITNIPREIGRSIERPFSVIVSRTDRSGKSRYGQHSTWIDYRLNQTNYNKPGIKKMIAYINEQSKKRI